ncbi:MAG: hypothetical protein ABH803_01315 [Candidatus Micrarchaeota archaeon]
MIRKYFEYYKKTNATRLSWFSNKWRALVATAAALLIIIINDYIQGKYIDHVVLVYKAGELVGTGFTLADKYMDGFVSGLVFGVIAVAVMLELEYMHNLKTIIKSFEEAAWKEINALSSKPKKALKKKNKSKLR